MRTTMRRAALSGSLIDEIAGLLTSLKTSLVFAPAYGGKSTLARKVAERLNNRSLNLFRFEFPPDAIIEDARVAFRSIVVATADFGNPSSIDGFRDFLADLSVRSGKPSIVILNHLDGLSAKLAEEFAGPFLTSSGKSLNAAALITTESNIFELFLGETAKFRCPNTFLLQGCDLPAFKEIIEQGSANLSISFDKSVPLEWLWHITGGNTFLALELVWAYLYDRVLRGQALRQYSLTQDDVNAMAVKLTRPGLEECPLFREATETIDSNVTYLHALGDLISNGSYDPGGDYTSLAHPLEVVGVARYVDGVMRFSSELMERFIREEFSPRRLGHFHALAGTWDEAFGWYARQQQDLASPPSFRERLILEEVLRRLRHALQQSSQERLDYLFENAVTYIFGLEIPDRAAETSEAYGAAEASRTLFSLSVDDYAPIPAWAKSQFPELLNAYANASDANRHKQAARGVRKLRLALSQSVAEILSNLYLDQTSPALVLRHASSRLVESGAVSDAIFWLVDSGKLSKFINGLQISEMPPLEEISLTHLLAALNCESASLVFDSQSWPPAARPWATATAEGGCLLIPLRDGKRNLGVFYVAMPEGRTASTDEISEFEQFAQPLTAAVLQAANLWRISKALDCIGEPIIVLDRSRRPTFRNFAAQTLLPYSSANALETYPGAQFEQGICTAFEGTRYVEFPTRIADRCYEGTVIYEPLRSSQGDLLGVLIHIRQKSHYADVVNVMRALEESSTRDEALEKLVTILQNFGHKWVRVYRVDGSRLVPEKCRDPLRPHVEKVFDRVHLPENSEAFSWKAIRSRTPQVFSYVPTRNAGEKFLTPRGLSVIAEPDPPEAALLDKHPGDLWIDFPLVTETEVYGKITISCDDDLVPERFQMMQLLSVVCGETLIAIGKREGLGREKRIAEQRMAELRTVLCERLGPLQMIRSLVENLTRDGEIADRSAAEYCALFDSALEKLHQEITGLASGTTAVN